MKKILSFLCIVALCTNAVAQTKVIPISPEKTVSLVFTDPVIHVDRGSSKVLVQQVLGADNIILVKATDKTQDTTTISVITKPGEVYAFMVYPLAALDTLVYHCGLGKRAATDEYARSLLTIWGRGFSLSDRKYDMSCRVGGIYIKDDVVFFHLLIENLSPIPFDVDILKFSIKNRQKSKRSAVQEIEMIPISIVGNSSRIPSFTKSALVVAFHKFTLPDGKFLGLQLFEENGGRHLQLKIRNRHLVKAAILPDLK